MPGNNNNNNRRGPTNNNGRSRGGQGGGGGGVPRFQWPQPPFDGASGKWVNRNQLPQGKSFGFFMCFSCENTWTSAHAQAAYRQDCLSCRKPRYPLLMWKNNGRGDAGPGPAGRPHLSQHCEACKRGVCKRA